MLYYEFWTFGFRQILKPKAGLCAVSCKDGPFNHILIMFCIELTLELVSYIDLKIVFYKVLVRNWLHNKISGLNYFDVVYQTASKYALAPLNTVYNRLYRFFGEVLFNSLLYYV